VKFSKATIVITGDAVTSGIEKYAPWLVAGNPEENHHPEDNGSPLRDVPLAHLIKDGDFWSRMQ
jgi:hypothetical protein